MYVPAGFCHFLHESAQDSGLDFFRAKSCKKITAESCGKSKCICVDICVRLHRKIKELVGKCKLRIRVKYRMYVHMYVLTLVDSVMFLPISLELIIVQAKHHDVCACSSSSSYAVMTI